MIRDIFTNKWIIGAISLLIIIACGCYVWYRYNTTTYEKQAAEAAQYVHLWENHKAKQKAATKTETASTSIPTDGNTRTIEKLLKHPGKEIILKPEDLYNLPPEQQKAIFDSFYTQLELDPPPKGYDYVWADINVPMLDENGKPILHKIGEPLIDIKQGIGYAPTLEEYKILKVLEIEIGWQEAQGNTTKAEALQSEYDQLYQKVQRERPIIEGWSWVASKSEQASDPDKPRLIARERLAKALKAQGLEHLIEILQVENMW